jgi:uncharacterized protein (DUF1697 family)
MPRYFAFLRAINVGGRTVKMDELRRTFESLGFRNVETFIASGNVIFDSAAKDPCVLELKIQKKLHAKLGYDVPVFLRSAGELAAIADHQPFSGTALASAALLNVGFLAAECDDSARDAVTKLRTEVDDFHLHGREIYWLLRKRQMAALVTLAKLEKALGGRRCTFRTMNTVQRMVAKFCQ